MEWLFIAAALTLYLLPSIVAERQRHPSAGGIVIVNLFLGWTLLGWVIALAWACSYDARRATSTGEIR